MNGKDSEFAAGQLRVQGGSGDGPRLISLQVHIAANGYVIMPQFDMAGYAHGVQNYVATDDARCLELIGQMLKRKNGIRVPSLALVDKPIGAEK